MYVKKPVNFIMEELRERGNAILELISRLDFLVRFNPNDKKPLSDDIMILSEIMYYGLLSCDDVRTIAELLFRRDVALDGDFSVEINTTQSSAPHFEFAIKYNNAVFSGNSKHPNIIRIYEEYNSGNRYEAKKYEEFFKFWGEQFQNVLYQYSSFSSPALLQSVPMKNKKEEKL